MKQRQDCSGAYAVVSIGVIPHPGPRRAVCVLPLALVLLAICWALNASASDKPLPAPDFSLDANNAVLYVYREKRLKAASVSFKNYLNDELVAELENGDYARRLVAPGKYDFWALFGSSNPSRTFKEVNLKRGRIYFVKNIPIFGFYWHIEPQLVDEATARKDIAELYEAAQ